MTTSSETPPRHRPLWRWFAVLVAVLIGGVAIWVWTLARIPPIEISPETTVIERPLKENGTVDYIAALNESASEGVTAENNAAVLLIPILGTDLLPVEKRSQTLELLDIEEPANDAPRYRSSDHFLSGGDESTAQFFESQEHPWSPDDFPEVAAWIEANSQGRMIIHEAARHPRYYIPFVPMPGGPEVFTAGFTPATLWRDVARLLNASAMLSLGEGAHEEAWDDILACHQLARLIGQSPFVIPRIIAIAIDAMAFKSHIMLFNADPPAALLARMMQETRDLSPVPSTAAALDLGERYCMADTIQSLFRTGGSLPGVSDGSVSLFGVDPNALLREMNQEYDQSVAAMSIPSADARYAALARIEHQARVTNSSGWAASLIRTTAERAELSTEPVGEVIASLMPAGEWSRMAEDRGIARHRMLMIANALVSFHQDTGVYPTTLSELSPGWIETLAVDPLSDDPFGYIRDADDSVRLYSVGDNRIDDGGAAHDDFVIRLGSVPAE